MSVGVWCWAPPTREAEVRGRVRRERGGRCRGALNKAGGGTRAAQGRQEGVARVAGPRARASRDRSLRASPACPLPLAPGRPPAADGPLPACPPGGGDPGGQLNTPCLLAAVLRSDPAPATEAVHWGVRRKPGAPGQVTVRKGTHTCGHPQHAVSPRGLPFSVVPAWGRGTTALSTAQGPLFWSSDHDTFHGGPHAQTQTRSVVPTSPWGETEAGSGGILPGNTQLLPAEHFTE